MLTVLICKSQMLITGTLETVGVFLIYVYFFFNYCVIIYYLLTPRFLKKCQLVITHFHSLVLSNEILNYFVSQLNLEIPVVLHYFKFH